MRADESVDGALRLAKPLAALEEASGEAEDEDEVALRVEEARAAQRVLVAVEPRTPGRRGRARQRAALASLTSPR